MHEIPAPVWTAEVRGSNLKGSSLAEEIGEAPTRLVFLRHLG